MEFFETMAAKFAELCVSFGGKLLAAILVFVIGTLLIKLLMKILRKKKIGKHGDPTVHRFVLNLVKTALYIVLAVTVVAILGVPMASMVALIASAGVAIGLALQGSLSNLAGGIMILLFKPFKVGDYIEAAGETGTVNEISVMYTEILTLDNKRITIPNGSITNSVIENYSSEATRRVDLTFNTAYSNDVEKVKEVIMGVVEKHPAALKTPAPFVRLSGHKESSLEYTVRIWCNSADYWDVYFDTMENVKKAFDENNIQIPYSQLDVHIEK